MNESYCKTVESCLDRLSLVLDTLTAVTEIEGRALSGAALVLLDVTIELETVLKGFDNGKTKEKAHS